MRSSIQVIIILSVVFYLGIFVPPCQGYGRGFFLEYGYGELDIENSADDAIHNAYGLGLMFLTNVSRAKIFSYRLAVSGTYNFINHYRYESYYWYDSHPEGNDQINMFYDDEGWGLTMSHSFMFGLIRRAGYRIELGPSLKLRYTEFDGKEGRAWIYRTFGVGPELAFNYHLNERSSLSLILNYYTDQNVSAEIDSYNAQVYSLRLSYVLRSKSERTTLAEEPEPPPRASAQTSEPQPVGSPLKTNRVWSAPDKGTVVIRCFPRNCQITFHRHKFSQELPLLVLKNVPVGDHMLTVSWGEHSIEQTISATAGGTLYVIAHREARLISVQPTVCQRFIENDDGTLTDVFTALQWSQTTLSETANWSESLRLVREFTLADQDNWRLPTIFELEDLVVSEGHPCAPSTAPGKGLPGLFKLTGSACWSSTEGEHSVMRAGATIWIMNFLNGTREWSAPERHRQILPVRWTDDHSITWQDLNKLVLDESSPQAVPELLGPDIAQIDSTDFKARVFNSTQPSAVLFLKDDGPNVAGLAHVFRYLRQTFPQGINFYVHRIEPEVSIGFETLLNSTAPATIALYGRSDDRISLSDTFNGHLTRSDNLKQKYIQLGMWLYDKLIGTHDGVFYKGHYYHLQFAGASEPRTEIIEGPGPDTFDLIDWAVEVDD